MAAPSPAYEYYPYKYFKFEKIAPLCSKTAVIKTKDKKNSKWKSRFVGLYFNYIVFFENGKGKGGGPTDKAAEAKASFPLELIKNVSKVPEFTMDKEGYHFILPIKDELFGDCALLFDNEPICVEWLTAIKSTVEQINRAEKRLPVDETVKRLATIQQTFPENLRIPYSVPFDEGEKYIANMHKWKQEVKEISPWVHSLGLFGENQVGRVKGYQSWFVNPTKGVQASINLSEESVMRDWVDRIKKPPKEMQAATETMFYLEDLQPVIENAVRSLKYIDLYNQYQREFNGVNAPAFNEERQLTTAWIQKLQTYPNSQDVSMKGFTDGRMNSDGGEETWSYSASQFSIKRTTTDQVFEDVEFNCRDHHCQFINNLYGIVLWNNKSFVWTHPRCPFIIRYDWYASKGVFKQYIPAEPKGKQPPSLTDWQLAGKSFRAVTVGKREPAPEVPDITSWTVEGNVPPPVILLVATFRNIRPIVRGILRMP